MGKGVSVTKYYVINVVIFFQKMGLPRLLFFVYFRSFQTNITIFTTNPCEIYSSSICHRDLNPRHLKHESSPIITKPGFLNFLLSKVPTSDFKMTMAFWNDIFLDHSDKSF